MFQLTNGPGSMGAVLTRMSAQFVLPRIWAHDHTVWRDDPTEITNRLGWLHLPETMPKRLDRIRRFVDGVREDGFRHVLLLGMGGSSLAPETFSVTFGNASDHPALHVLDSTHPDTVSSIEQQVDLMKTLFLVATKSGTTTETLALFRYFYNRAVASGASAPGRQFAAITDPVSPLIDVASRHGFRETFESDPNLGGRYSALSHFGLVPASLLGIDVADLLWRAQEVSRACAGEAKLEENAAARLGGLLGAEAGEGRDKVTFILSDEVSSFGSWAEQLIAESTGKDRTGLVPVVGEPVGSPDVYGTDRVFVHLRVAGDVSQDAAIEELAEAGHPVARIDLSDRYALGGQFFLWELATSIVGHILQINPFDQPNVEAAKVLSREMVKEYELTGSVPEVTTMKPTADVVARFLDASDAGDYVAIQAYLPPRKEVVDALGAILTVIRDQRRVATTVGFGPRFLHSTGQLHKGDRGNGLFIQLVVDPERDVPIPDKTGEQASTLTFGTLIAAQAAGDRQALVDAGRRVITLRLRRGQTVAQLQELAQGLS
jgi:transaldolase/glucose-6-phosphate isomerase